MIGKVILGENVAVTQTGKPQSGGRFSFSASATWGGGSVSLEQQLPGSTTVWVPVAGSALLANGSVVVELPPGAVRLVVATATAVYAYLVGI